MKPICFKIDDDQGNEVEHKLPSKWEICDRCMGQGKHDHPAFSNGLSQEDFDEDPDFRGEYMSGRYDVRCEDCRGDGKVLVPDEDRMDAAQKVIYELYLDRRSEDAREAASDAYTRRMENGGRDD